MGYHIEHHIFPTVPYYNLPQLHELVRDQLPPAYNGLIDAYREIISTLLRAIKDPNYYLVRVLPDAPPQQEDAHGSQAVVSEAAPDTGGWVEVCDLSLLLPGEVLCFEHRGKSYAVYGTQIGQLFGSENKCTHGNAELADGFLQGSCIECPRHNGRFDIRTGAVLRPRRVLL